MNGEMEKQLTSNPLTSDAAAVYNSLVSVRNPKNQRPHEA